MPRIPSKFGLCQIIPLTRRRTIFTFYSPRFLEFLPGIHYIFIQHTRISCQKQTRATYLMTIAQQTFGRETFAPSTAHHIFIFQTSRYFYVVTVTISLFYTDSVPLYTSANLRGICIRTLKRLREIVDNGNWFAVV